LRLEALGQLACIARTDTWVTTHARLPARGHPIAGGEGRVPVIVKEIEAKTVLVRSKLPDADYVVNPYTGCEFGCQYCYASFTGRFVNEPVANWGNYVYAKVNAVPLFEVELQRMRRAGRAPSLLLSSVTDPYQGAEKKYRLTRGILAREHPAGVPRCLDLSASGGARRGDP
jgi:DNA repair photolyase